MPAQQPVCVLRDLVQNLPIRPCRFTEHMVQGLLIRLRHHLFHPFHVLGFGLEQTLNILLSRRLDGPCPLAEMPPEALTKVHEALTHPGQQSHFRRGGRVFLRLPRMSLAYVTLSILSFDQD